MKASKQCPKCHSLKVGYLEHVLDHAYNRHVDAVVGLTSLKVSAWSGPLGEAKGTFEAYVCSACGYYETYVKDPASVPFEQIAGFHWLNEHPDSGQPYR
jgi:predicted nucleic-acid-binding Zn-ribbon protein